MKQFIIGFIIASLLWAGVFYAQSAGLISIINTSDQTATAALPETFDTDTAEKKTKTKKKKRRKKSKRRKYNASQSQPAYETGVGVSGDSLETEGRELSMGSRTKEEQLSSFEIDKGIDRKFRGIQRCLVLVPSEAPATGKVIFGMHIASTGKVTKVNLKGPNAIIKGESGACLRRTVKSIRFRSFDGPDMIAHYPITFE